MNIFDSGCDALVNPVNCVGVMGAGLAAQFKERYPDAYSIYRRDCFNKLVRLGEMHIVWTQGKHIIHFPTKYHWRDKSKLEDIEAGLEDLTNRLPESNITSIAVPALGCGLGGLKWGDVRPLIEAAAERVPEVKFLIYPPKD